MSLVATRKQVNVGLSYSRRAHRPCGGLCSYVRTAGPAGAPQISPFHLTSQVAPLLGSLAPLFLGSLGLTAGNVPVASSTWLFRPAGLCPLRGSSRGCGPHGVPAPGSESVQTPGANAPCSLLYSRGITPSFTLCGRPCPPPPPALGRWTLARRSGEKTQMMEVCGPWRSGALPRFAATTLSQALKTVVANRSPEDLFSSIQSPVDFSLLQERPHRRGNGLRPVSCSAPCSQT